MKLNSIVIVILLTLLSGNTMAQRGGFGKTNQRTANPFRVYSMLYDLENPGIYLGPELDFIWTRHEKLQCDRGMKVIDKRLLFIPNFGVIFDRNAALNIFAGMEVDYQVVYDLGGIFELFAGIGYNVRFGDGINPLSEQKFNSMVLEGRGNLMPQFGIGTGFDFDKRRHRIPIKANLRLLTTTLQPSESFYNPTIQLGVTIGRH